ncbi:hypothetical protein [Kitasatospora sp. NPDC050543]|uniref:hypothetical protein n=1 Tax=Kitasatospora sp. NPDC050543 TaxID=3364054 RepID=UPI0037B9134E
MNNAPHLLAEDRPDFERLLDDTLRDGTIQAALHPPGGEATTDTGPRLTSEQLRTKTLLAANEVAAGAAAEYEHYTRLRANLRDTGEQPPPAPAPDHRPAVRRAGARGGGQTLGELAAQLRSEDGAGLLPVLVVLAPILAGAAAVVFLLIGYVLRAAAPRLVLGRSLLTAGWLALAIGTAAMVIGIIGLLLTALRDSSATPDGADPDLHAEVADARRAWQLALRERALLPYLRANLDSEPALPPHPPAPRPATEETTEPREAREPSTPPDFTSPGYSSAGYSSPGFTSPGVEGVTDPDGRTPRTADFSSPGYSPPSFTSPDDV